LFKVLDKKWNHLLPLPSAFQSELFRWYQYGKRQPAAMSVTSLIASHADATFFPNVRELLKILVVLPIGSTEAERSFSCVRRIHTWLRSSMATERLSDLAVIAMHAFEIPVSREAICRRYVAQHTRRMQSGSLFADELI